MNSSARLQSVLIKNLLTVYINFWNVKVLLVGILVEYLGDMYSTMDVEKKPILENKSVKLIFTNSVSV